MSQKAFEFGAQGVADYVCFKVFHQGFRERARVPQLVMLCRRWAHLQCFAGRTGRTHGTTAGYCVAGKRTQYRNIRPQRSQILMPSPLTPCLQIPQHSTHTFSVHSL